MFNLDTLACFLLADVFPPKVMWNRNPILIYQKQVGQVEQQLNMNIEANANAQQCCTQAWAKLFISTSTCNISVKNTRWWAFVWSQGFEQLEARSERLEVGTSPQLCPRKALLGKRGVWSFSHLNSSWLAVLSFAQVKTVIILQTLSINIIHTGIPSNHLISY